MGKRLFDGANLLGVAHSRFLSYLLKLPVLLVITGIDWWTSIQIQRICLGFHNQTQLIVRIHYSTVSVSSVVFQISTQPSRSQLPGTVLIHPGKISEASYPTYPSHQDPNKMNNVTQRYTKQIWQSNPEAFIRLKQCKDTIPIANRKHTAGMDILG